MEKGKGGGGCTTGEKKLRKIEKTCDNRSLPEKSFRWWLDHLYYCSTNLTQFARKGVMAIRNKLGWWRNKNLRKELNHEKTI
ncbi:hypothetical protein ES703_113238 [subsurface metagenome]